MLQRWGGWGSCTYLHILAHLFFCQVLLSLAIDLRNNEREFTIQCTLKFLRIWMHENCWQQTKSYLSFFQGTLHDPSSSSSSSLVAMLLLLLLLRSPVVVPYLEREEEALMMQMLQAPHHDNISRGIFFFLLLF
jgi:hypothetical protein